MDNTIARKPLVIVIAAIVTVALGAVIWQAGYKQGAKGSMAGFPGPGAVNIPPITDMRTVSGTVKEIKDSSLVISLAGGPGSPFKNGSTRTVEIGKDTVLEKTIPKDMADFSKEMEDFNKKMQKAGANVPGSGAGSPAMPPQPFTKKSISLSDLKVGDTVAVAADVNIIKTDKFTAKSVTLQEMPKAPAVPTAPAVPSTTSVPPVPNK